MRIDIRTNATGRHYLLKKGGDIIANGVGIIGLLYAIYKLLKSSK